MYVTIILEEFESLMLNSWNTCAQICFEDKKKKNNKT